jgi:hypothetical protein
MDTKSVVQFLPRGSMKRFVWALIATLVLLASMGDGAADAGWAGAGLEVILGAGKREGYKWRVSGHGEARRRGRVLCVSVRLTSPRNLGLPGGVSSECRSTDEFPIMSTMVIGSGESQGSVSTFVTPRKVAFVLLGLRDGTQERIRLKSSTKKLQASLGIQPFSYLILGRVGLFCITAITTLSANGEVIERSGAIPCTNR